MSAYVRNVVLRCFRGARWFGLRRCGIVAQMSTETKPRRALRDAEIGLAIAEHGTIAAASRALQCSPSTIYRRLHRIPGLRDLNDGPSGLAAQVRLRVVHLMGTAVETTGALLKAANPTHQLAAARLLGSWATSGALAASERDSAEARGQTASPEQTLRTHAIAQCTHAETVASLIVEHELSEIAAETLVRENAEAFTRYARHGRALMRTRAMALVDDPKMVAELARQYSGWSRSGYADDVIRGVERAEEREH